jgi:glycosyltransferase involved in cell wall biosynthesis
MAARLVRRRPDTVVVYTPHELPFVALGGWLARVPVVYRDQNGPGAGTNVDDWRPRWFTYLFRWCVAGIVPTTRAEADHLISSGVRPEIVRQVYLGVDSTRFCETASDPTRTRAELGIPPGAKVLGFFARLIALKGHSTFLKAVAKLDRRDVHTLVVGGTQLNAPAGPAYERSLRKLVSDLGLADRVHFLGFRPDVPRLMSACDIVCNASQWETFGLVLVEAMLCRVPVIAADVSGPREIVVPGQTGLLFPSCDADAMAARIRELLGDPARLRQFGRAGQRRAREHFDLVPNLEQLHETIEHFVLAARGHAHKTDAPGQNTSTEETT